MKMRRKASARAAFTLVEVLISISLSLMVIAAATSLVVSLSLLWTQAQSQPWYNEHVDGLERFMRSSFTSSEVPIIETEDKESPTQGQSQKKDTRAKVSFKKLPGEVGLSDVYLSFFITGKTPLLHAEDQTKQPLLTAYLDFRQNDGLYLIWHGDPEPGKEEPDMYNLRLSPHVTKVQYAYFDEEFKSWDSTDEPKEEENEYPTPEFIELTIQAAGQPERVLTFLLPPEELSAPIY